MISLSSRALQFFAGTFGLYHAVLGFLNLDSYQFLGPAWLALLLYIAALSASVVFWRGILLPTWIAVFNLVVVVLLPLMITAAIGSLPATPYTTWHVAATGTLLAITAVRGHKVVAWVGISFMTVEVLVWGGLAILFNAGLIGAVLLVLAAQAASSALDESSLIAQKFRDQALETEAATVAKSAARVEREQRIKSTLAGVLPQLEQIVHGEGKLTEQQRKVAILTEAELRDQIRGRSLVHPRITEQTRLARIRGVEVQLLDDGGLDQLDESDQQKILNRVASELSKISSGRVVIRSVAGEQWSLTMTAVQKGAEQPDLFLRL